MVMSAERVDAIKRQGQDEAARRSHPDHFPALPGVPAARYSDPDFARLEQAAVFGHAWLMVAHLDELAEPGDFRLVDQVPQPVVLLRGADAEVRAFYNTCQHRGAELVVEPSGNAGRRLTCPYHSWVYDLDGSLVGYPEANNFPELDRDCLSLRSVRCETWGPLVFINLDDAARPLSEFLGTVGEDLSELAELAGRLHLVNHPSLEVDVNWKLPVDANIETYHVNTVHRDSAARILDQAATSIQLLRNGHSRMLVGTRDGKSMGDLMPFEPLFDGVGDLPDAGTFSFHVFPNLSIVFSGKGFVFFITNWPIGANRSSYHVHFCSSLASATEEDRALNEAFAEINRSVLLEDLSVLPGMQRSIDSGGLDQVRLGYQERRIYHLHETIDRFLGEGAPDHLRVPPMLADHLEV
jgi:phenylpropionate dioxygenase-like ring-hydroxylating dioxygenase large terminal subunit